MHVARHAHLGSPRSGATVALKFNSSLLKAHTYLAVLYCRLLCTVCVTQRMVNLCPDALLDDGLLDFTLLFGSLGKQVSRPRLAAMWDGRVRGCCSCCGCSATPCATVGQSLCESASEGASEGPSSARQAAGA